MSYLNQLKRKLAQEEMFLYKINSQILKQSEKMEQVQLEVGILNLRKTGIETNIASIRQQIGQLENPPPPYVAQPQAQPQAQAMEEGDNLR